MVQDRILALERWYNEKSLGQSLLLTEEAEMARILPRLYGVNLLQVGCPYVAPITRASSAPYATILTASSVPSALPQVLGLPTALPFDASSMHVIVLSHILELSTTPHTILREVDRVLVPEGHVVITGFNPWSLWGVWRLLARFGRQPPWQRPFLSAGRIRDWLSVLGYELVESNHYFFRPPVSREAVLNKLQFLERVGADCWPFCGGGYVIVAKKRVIALTPIKPRLATKVLPKGLEPTARMNKP